MPRTFSDDTLPSATQVIPFESIEAVNATQTGTVEANTTEYTVVTPPSGYLYVLLCVYIWIEPPDNATTGRHECSITTENIRTDFTKGESYYDEIVSYDEGSWEYADYEQEPASTAAQALMGRSLRASEDNGITLRYENKTDADQTNDRVYRLSLRKIKVA